MKKILLILISLIFITGCYDNIELNDINIIIGIGVEYENDEYKVTYEILNSEKSSDSITMNSYTENGTGKTISAAFDNANSYLSRKPYYSHAKILLLNKNVENDKLKELFEYLIRNADIRNEFNVLVTDDSVKDILKNTNESVPVVSLELYDMINNSKYGTDLAITTTFEKLFSASYSNKADMIISTIELKDKNIKLIGGTTYNKYNVKKTLEKSDTSLYTLIKNNTNGSEYTKIYDDDKSKVLTIKSYNSNIDISITEDKIKVSGILEALLLNNTTDLSLEKYEDLVKMNNDMKEIIDKKIKQLLINLQEDQTDIFGLSEIYYRKYRKNNNTVWKYLDIDVDIDVKVNNKGLIFEV